MQSGSIDFITIKLAAAFDRYKLNDRVHDAVHILIAAAETLGNGCKKIIINRNSIRRCHLKLRKEWAENV